MAISLSKTGNAIKFTFEDNAYYLSNGVIEVPLNSLTLVTDDSDMFTFKKSATNDVFISGRYSDIGMTKSELESYYKENMVGSTGGGGVTSGEVQTMIDESISGKADTSDVQNVASDVATVSGDVNTLSGSVNALTGAVNTLSGDVSTLSGSVDSNHNAITAINGDVQTLSGQVQGDEAILTGHTANTDIHVTASDKQNWNNKSDFSGSYNDLTDKPTIPVVPTNVSAFNNDAGYVTQANIDAAVSGKVNTTDFNTYSASTDNRLSEDEEVTSAALNALNAALDDKADTTAVTASIAAAVSGKADSSAVTEEISAAVSGKADLVSAVTDIMVRDILYGRALQYKKGDGGYSTKTYFGKINDSYIVDNNNHNIPNFSLVETSAITSSVTSASTDSQVPSAKAVYDALQEGGGGVPESAFTTYTASTDARLSEDEEVTAAGLNALNDALSGKQDTLSAGTNITISGNVISADGGGKAIEAGRGISVTTGATADTVSFDLPISADTNGIYTTYHYPFEGDSMKSKNAVFGLSNKINRNGGLSKYASYNLLFGENNQLGNGESSGSQKMNGNLFGGYGNRTLGLIQCSVALGQLNKIGNNFEFTSGYYNNSVSATTTFGDSGNTIFSVGNGGHNDNARHNAIEIRQNGDVYFPDTDNTTYQNWYEKPMVRLQDVYGALGGLKLVQISQSDYDNLQNKDASTLYIITGSN